MDMSALFALSSALPMEFRIRNAEVASLLDHDLSKLEHQKAILNGKIPFLKIEECFIKKKVVLKEKDKSDKVGIVFRNVMGAVWILFEDASSAVYAFDEPDSVFSENPQDKHLFSLSDSHINLAAMLK